MSDNESKTRIVRGYGRASTDSQTLSTAQQEAKIFDAFGAYQKIKEDWANATWGGFMADEATSRVSTFRERHAGSLTIAASKPGDIILVSNYDRIFANVVDVCDTLKLLHERNIGLVILDCDIDTTTILGAFCFKVLALVKELDVLEIRRRTRESKAHRRRLGRPYTGSIPIGWKHQLYRVPGIHLPQKYLVPNYRARRLAREILIIQERYGGNQGCQFANVCGLKQVNGRRWQPMTFNKWCKAAVNDFPLPNGSHEAAPIPPDAVPISIETISADE